MSERMTQQELKLANRKHRRIGLIVLGIFIMGIVFSLFYNKEDLLTRKQTLDLLKMKNDIEKQQEQNSFEKDNIGEVQSKFRPLLNLNENFVGWVTIEGTGMDYPVLAGNDYKRFLTMSFFGEYNENGSLAVDEHSSIGTGVKGNYVRTPGMNLIIHGNNRSSGLMFGRLLDFQTKEFAKEHSKITFETLYEKREYQVISVFFDDADERRLNPFQFDKFCYAKSKEEFQYFYDNIQKKALYETEIKANYNDEFLTLTTPVKDGKFAVIAVRLK